MILVEESTIRLHVRQKEHSYTVQLEQDEDGRYVATIPLLPGAITDGATKLEAMNNIHESAKGVLECLSYKKKVDPNLKE